jgi:hypothetical protein
MTRDFQSRLWFSGAAATSLWLRKYSVRPQMRKRLGRALELPQDLFFITCGPNLDWPSALLADYNAAFMLKNLPRCFASYDCTGQQPLDSGTGRDERRTRAALTGTVFFTLSRVCRLP